MHVTLYHNPNCSNSRGALKILQDAGADIRIVEYLTTPLTPGELVELARRMKATAGAAWSVRDMMRTKERDYIELFGHHSEEAQSAVPKDDALLAAIATHPILLNRPIVATERGAKLCRPPDLVRELL